jgi:hypothetical protein
MNNSTVQDSIYERQLKLATAEVIRYVMDIKAQDDDRIDLLRSPHIRGLINKIDMWAEHLLAKQGAFYG